MRRGTKLNGSINPASADKFFGGSGHRAAPLIEAALKGDSIPRFDLPVTIRATIAVDTWQVESQNVIGILPGAKRTERRISQSIPGSLASSITWVSARQSEA